MIAPIEKRDIYLETWFLFGEPFRDSLLGEPKERRKPMQRFGSRPANIRDHALVNRAVALDAIKMSFAIFFERAQKLNGASAPQPRSHLQHDFRTRLGFQDR